MNYILIILTVENMDARILNKRLFETFISTTVESASSNLISLGYQKLEKPTNNSFYFNDFDSKELFIDFLEDYNTKME
ncbi:MAG: hypothetical protein ACI4XD_02765 [Clostridia bacterium]